MRILTLKKINMKPGLSSLSDEILISEFKQGNSEAFGFIIERYSQKLSIGLLVHLQDSFLVEDVLQDTFLKAMNQIQKGNYEHEGNLHAWLTRIAHNLAVDYFRKLKRFPITPISDIEIDDQEENPLTFLIGKEKNPEEELIMFEADYNIQFLIDELPEEQREIVKLRFFHGFSFKEIADYIGGGMSINTCLGRMRYALIKLRKKITELKTERRKVS